MMHTFTSPERKYKTEDKIANEGLRLNVSRVVDFLFGLFLVITLAGILKVCLIEEAYAESDDNNQIINITINNVWEDSDNNDGKRDTVRVSLYADGEPAKYANGSDIEMHSFSENRNESFTFEYLPSYKDDRKIIYTIKAEPVADYETKISDASFDDNNNTLSFTITNSHEIETISYPLIVSWYDYNDEWDTRPDSRNTKIYANTGWYDTHEITQDIYGNPIIISAEDADPDNPDIWKKYITLPKYSEGKKVYYGWYEYIPAGYLAEVYEESGEGMDYLGPDWAGSILTNHTSYNFLILGELIVFKTWDDENDLDKLRPTPEEFVNSLTLYRNNKRFDLPPDYVTAEDVGNNKYKIKYSVPIYDKNGNTFKYSIEESLPKGYTMNKQPTPTITEMNIVYRDSDTLKAEAEIILSNKHVPGATNLIINKVWDDEQNLDGVRPATDEMKNYFKLYQKIGSDGDWTEVDDVSEPSITEEDNSNWTVKWSDLPGKTLVNGQTENIIYGVTEILPADSPYSAKIGDNITTAGNETTKVENGGTITNIYTPESVSVTATKIWEGETTEIGTKLRTDISLSLYGYKDGEVVYNAGNRSIEKDETASSGDEAGVATWTGVPKGYINDSDIEWKVVENPVFGYISSVTGNAKEGFIVTNTYVEPVATINVTKEWQDSGDNDGIRPSQITYELWSKVGIDGEPSKIDEKSVTESDDWEFQWENLPLINQGEINSEEGDEDSKDNAVVPIHYIVKEKPVHGYDTVVETADSGVFKITNIHEIEKKDIYVKKVWDDKDNADGVRPDNVIFRLSDGRNHVAKAIISEDKDWNYVFKDMPVNKNGKLISYKLTEDKVKGYSASMPSGNGDSDAPLIIVNTQTTGAPSDFTNDNSKVNTGDDSGIMFWSMLLTLSAVIGTLIIVIWYKSFGDGRFLGKNFRTYK